MVVGDDVVGWDGIQLEARAKASVVREWQAKGADGVRLHPLQQ
jgi:hypothetical protein